MKIAIVGPGAMGCLFAAMLGRSGQEVTLLDYNAERAQRIARDGIRFIEGEGESTVSVAATHDPATIGRVELVIITVKAPQTAKTAKSIGPLLGDKTPVLTIQNGLGPSDILAGELGPERILTGVTAQGATLLGPGHIRHGGTGPTLIGPHVAGRGANDELVAAFNAAGIETSWSEDVATSVWKKLAANCAINAVCALAGVKNGVIAEFAPAREVAVSAVMEVAQVAKGAGITLGDPDELAAWVVEVAKKTALNRCSMGQDVDRSNPTEVDFINGAVVRYGERYGVDIPVNRTLTMLVKSLEHGYLTGKKV